MFLEATTVVLGVVVDQVGVPLEMTFDKTYWALLRVQTKANILGFNPKTNIFVLDCLIVSNIYGLQLSADLPWLNILLKIKIDVPFLWISVAPSWCFYHTVPSV